MSNIFRNFATSQTQHQDNMDITAIWKWICLTIGGGVGWFVGEFQPTFPLMAVACVLILSDAWTAFQLDKRVHKKYPERVKREKAKFTSFAFGKVITTTIPKRLWLIIMAFIVEKWIFVHVSFPLSYIAAGAIAFEQIWSILENEASCRDDERESKFWKMLQRILIDKTERHFDVELNELKEEAVKDGETTMRHSEMVYNND